MVKIRRTNLFLGNSFGAIRGGEILAQIKFKRAQKAEITEFTFSDFDAAKQLLDYVVLKYKMPFNIKVDEDNKELAQLLILSGFRQCAYESLWKIEHLDAEPLPYREFKKSDAPAAAALYNEELITHFRHSLEREKNEFTTGYILERGGKPISYLSAENSVAEFSNSSGYDISLDGVLAFASAAGAQFIKLKKYTTNDFEKYLRDQNFEYVQTKHIFVKDFYKPVKQRQSLLSGIFTGRLSSHGCS